MPKGTVLPAESVETRDARTGVRVWQLTCDASINHHLYVFTSSMTPDGRHVVFASDRGGRPSFYLAGFPAGPIVQLTDAEGVNGFSAVLDCAGRTLYFTRAGEVRALDLATLRETVLADFPGGQLGEVSLSANGRLLAAALRRGPRWGLTVTATDGGGGRTIHESARTIIHPQFHPTDPTLLEYACDPAPRMWTIRADGAENTCVWKHGDDEFLVHETFLGAGDDLVVVRWPRALQRFSLRTRTMTPIAAFNAWHIAPTRDGRFVLCDTAHPDIGLQIVSTATGQLRTLCHPESSNGGHQWTKSRYATAEDWTANIAADTVYGPQWTHPHPSFSVDERRVVFTSDRTGHPEVYVAEVPPDFLA